MGKFLKDQWMLVCALFLLLCMSVPLYHFGNYLRRLNQPADDPEYVLFDRHPEVGICMNDLMENRWNTEKDVWTQEASKRKITLQIRIAHHSLARQNKQIRMFIRQKVKVLVIVPVNQSGLEAALREASQQGIKIILYDELTSGPADGYCGVSYYQIGRQQTEKVVSLAGPGNYLVFTGPKSSYKAEQLCKGQLEGLKKSMMAGKVRLLSTEALGNWSAEKAVLKTRTFITHQKIAAIIAPNDLIAQEIARFFQEQKLIAPFLAGIGGDPDFGERIQNGAHGMTMAVDYGLLARTAWDAAIRLLGNKHFPASKMLLVHSGKIPSVEVKCVPVLPPEPRLNAEDGIKSFQNIKK